jgi:ribonucleoside-diphosphate reductase alpha chain
LNLHHGVLITDDFMEAVRNGAEFELKSPKTGEVRGRVDARSLFQKLVETRLATGEPYIVFSDTVNRMMPKHHRELGLKVSTSNLCSEITLPTGVDHLGNDRTAVCCLSSLNLEKWDEWNGDKRFIEDVMRFLDNVLQDYIDRAPEEMARAKYSAMRERSVGMGVMGFHSFLQSKGLPLEGPMAKAWNLKMFQHISARADEASMVLAEERGPCPDAADMGAMERFSCKMAIAPTASISIICGGTSACIEPIPANIYTHKTLSGSFIVKNPYLEKLLRKKSKDSVAVWNSILEKGGSVAHLDFLNADEKAVFKTSFEIDQRYLLEFAADRTPYIDQAQSLNLFIPADVDKWDLAMLHFQAWEKGIKSLYYLRSKSVQRAGFAGGVEADNTADAPRIELNAGEQTDYEECLSCQ